MGRPWTFGAVLAMEAVNTAVEAVVDLVSPDHHPLPDWARTRAGALVFIVLGSLGVAVAIFGPASGVVWGG
ncbi:MAG: diacylglycerol kinase family protein [Caldilineaceae bacterium]